MKNQILEIKNAKKYFGNESNLVKAVNDISFKVNEGEFVIIMGASGSGKSTLLNSIATIDTLSSGNIYIDGNDISKLNKKQMADFRKKHLGFIFQEYNLLDTLTVEENIGLALLINKEIEFKEKITDVAEKLGIAHILNRYPHEISGGERQRTACARAIVLNPSLILADEPTGALDSKSAKDLLSSLKAMNEDYKSTILLVTHDSFTASYGSRVIFLKDAKIFTEIYRGSKSKEEFFKDIIDVVTILGGNDHVIS